MDKSSGPIVINESRWPEVVDDYSHLPQHYQRNNVPPEVVKHEYPNQYYVVPNAHQPVGPPPPPQQVNYANSSPQVKRYCGLSLFQLIVVIFLGTSIVLGAVLGGVFGSGVLYRKARSGTSSGDGNTSSSSDTSTSSSSLFGTDIPTRTATSYSSSTRNGGSTTATGLSANYCNNGTTYTSSSSDQYLILCAIDWPDDTIRPGTGVHDVKFLENQPTLAGCLDTCSTWPSGGDSTKQCRAVVWNYKYQCFLKNQTGRIADTFYEYDFKYIQAGVLLN